MLWSLQQTLIVLKFKHSKTLLNISILINVLRHSSRRDQTHVPPSRKRLVYGDSPDAVIPTPVKEILLNKPMPQLTDKEKMTYPPA